MFTALPSSSRRPGTVTSQSLTEVIRIPFGASLQFCLILAWMIVVPVKCAESQDAQPLVAATSDLSSALVPAEWSRVESAVDGGLRWLAGQQAADGRFPSKPVAQPAITSFAIMAFLSRGHVPDHGPYGKQISRAIDFVLSTQKRRGYFGLLPLTPGGGHPNTSQTVSYNHAIAGLMLGEVYGMTSGARSRQIEEALAKALLYSREVQTRTKAHPAFHGGGATVIQIVQPRLQTCPSPVGH